MTSDPESDSQPQLFKDDLNRHLRSASPAIKRPASDMGAQDREEHDTDVEMSNAKQGFTPINSDTQSISDLKAKQQDTGERHRERDEARQIPHISHPGAVSQDAPSDSTGTSLSDSLHQTSSIHSTAATSICMDVLPSTEPPSIDEQVAKIKAYIIKEPKDRQKGYVVSTKWLNRVHARSSDPAKSMDKSATEGDIGPVDNSDVALVTEDSGKLLDLAGEKFVSLRPGLRLGEEYQILPREAWDLIISWYGVAKDSPVITRYAYDISQPDAMQAKVEYEINPPIFSLLKVPCEHTAQTQRDANDPPVRLLSSKYMSANEWLRKSKELLHIEMSTKVRIWRILGGLKNTHTSGVLTPATSRSASPAPGAEIVASAGDRVLLDVNTFAALLMGEHREKLDVPDQTNNPKYNGNSTLDTFLLGGRNEVLAFEEQKTGAANDSWPSDQARSVLAKNQKDKVKGLIPSGRTSPALGVTTRGRSRQNERPRGITGLSNLGNTCYMNSALQSLRSVEELTQYFLHDQWKHDLNSSNPLGYRGEVAKAYASLIKQIYEETGSATWPGNFKKAIGKHGSQFSGYQQQDSQEFLLFLLDGLQEDLGRIQKKPYIEKPDSTDEMVYDQKALKEFADKNWDIYKARNDSIVTDLFAGMYKSTVTCPTCHRVSIIFDPFSNLTLQLPVENNWAREILYVGFGKRPIRIEVEIDKNSSIRTLKEFVAHRTDSQVENLIVAEDYKNRFYKIFDNPTILSEAQIQQNDIICVFELDAVPTNYNPNKRVKQNYTIYSTKQAEDDEVDASSPGADQLLIPLYHRSVKNPTSRNVSRPFFGIPTYVVLDRISNKTYDGVLRKILANVSAMSSKSLFEQQDFERDVSPENSDTVVMTDDGSGSGLNTTSEDGYVDIKMRDSDNPSKSDIDELPTANARRFLSSGKPLPLHVANLFDICVGSTGEAIVTGWNSLSEHTDFPSIKTRIPKAMPHRPARKDDSNSSDADSGSENSEGDLPDIDFEEATPDTGGSAADSDVSDAMPSMGEETPEISMRKSKGRQKGNKGKSYKGQNRTFLGKIKSQPRPAIPKQPVPAAHGPGLIKPGEAIILDWNPDAYDALFAGAEDDLDEMRGAATWKFVSMLPDEQLHAKRAERLRRRKNGITLEECLNEFGKSETLSEQNLWYCSRCKEHRRADKKLEVWKAPDILVMHLKRFSSNRNFRDKLEVRVEYPIEGLDLTKMVQDTEDKNMIYDLIAVDNHYGGLGGGHYTAYAKHSGNGKWYEYNDTHASPRDPQAVVTSAAYLLFYRRRSEHPLGGPVLEKLLANSAEADSDETAESREPSPVAGEGQRLGDSSHNGLSSAYPVGRAHLVGDGGSLLTQNQDQHQGIGIPQRSIEKQRSSNDDPPAYSIEYELEGEPMQTIPHDPLSPPTPPNEDEAVDMDYDGANYPSQWGIVEPGWSFNKLANQSAQPPNSDADEMFGDGDQNSSNDSTRVEGNAGSEVSDEGYQDTPMFSDANVPDDAHRGMRESAPPPMEDLSQQSVSAAVNVQVMPEADDDDELPVVEIPPPP